MFNGENLDLLNKNYANLIQNSNSDIFLWNRIYNGKVVEYYTLMKKYYLMAIELGNINAMCSIINYFDNIEQDYTQIPMKKYYFMKEKQNYL